MQDGSLLLMDVNDCNKSSEMCQIKFYILLYTAVDISLKLYQASTKITYMVMQHNHLG